MSPVSEMSHLPMILPPNSFTIKINIAFIWENELPCLPRSPCEKQDHR